MEAREERELRTERRVCSEIALPPVKPWSGGLTHLIRYPSTPVHFASRRQSGNVIMRDEKKKFLKALAILGSAALIVTAWILLSRLKRLGYVDSAIGSLRVLVNSEAKFAQTHPHRLRLHFVSVTQRRFDSRTRQERSKERVRL